jgi:hypothetical protein
MRDSLPTDPKKKDGDGAETLITRRGVILIYTNLKYKEDIPAISF